jgi:hypothetical protein
MLVSSDTLSSLNPSHSWISAEAVVSLAAAWAAHSPALLTFGGDSAVELPRPSAVTRSTANRLSSVRNDLQIAEFFEPIFAEFNANP